MRRNPMTNLPEFEPAASRQKLVTGLHLAITEARKVHTLITRKTAPRNLEEVKKLVNVERELDYLETTLFEIESAAETEES